VDFFFGPPYHKTPSKTVPPYGRFSPCNRAMGGSFGLEVARPYSLGAGVFGGLGGVRTSKKQGKLTGPIFLGVFLPRFFEHVPWAPYFPCRLVLWAWFSGGLFRLGGGFFTLFPPLVSPTPPGKKKQNKIFKPKNNPTKVHPTPPPPHDPKKPQAKKTFFFPELGLWVVGPMFVGVPKKKTKSSTPQRKNPPETTPFFFVIWWGLGVCFFFFFLKTNPPSPTWLFGGPPHAGLLFFTFVVLLCLPRVGGPSTLIPTPKFVGGPLKKTTYYRLFFFGKFIFFQLGGFFRFVPPFLFFFFFVGFNLPVGRFTILPASHLLSLWCDAQQIKGVVWSENFFFYDHKTPPPGFFSFSVGGGAPSGGKTPFFFPFSPGFFCWVPTT